MKNPKDIVDLMGKLMTIASIFRCNDEYFKDLELRDRTFFNIIGKLLENVYFLLSKYQYAKNEDVEIDILQIVGTTLKFMDEKIESVFKKQREE